MTPRYPGVMTKNRAWWVEVRRSADVPFVEPTHKAGWDSTMNEAESRAQAAKVNAILGWEKYRVVSA